MSSVGRWFARLLMLLLVLAVFAAIGYLDRRDREIMRQLHGATGRALPLSSRYFPSTAAAGGLESSWIARGNEVQQG